MSALTTGSHVTEKLRHLVEKSNPVVFTAFAGLAGFAAYFSMYAFRKPFSAATFDRRAGMALRARLQDRPGDRPGGRLRALEIHRHQGHLRDQPGEARRAIIILIGGPWLALLLFAVIPRALERGLPCF